MKMFDVEITDEEIRDFISNTIYGFDRMKVYGSKRDYLTLEMNKYIVFKNGKYDAQNNPPREQIVHIAFSLIEKYKKFEYKNFLYHSPDEFGMWIKEEI